MAEPRRALTMTSSPRAARHIGARGNRRFVEGGFDLDLTYIKPNIIAMGFPSEGIFRNNLQDFIRFLDTRHPDHYKVYNLCSRASYIPAKFHHRVATYPIGEDMPPQFELIGSFCEDVSQWLHSDGRNVVAIHCKDGKSRAGVMICSYLLHDQVFDSVADTLRFFAEARTENSVGVTIPCQKRYVEYFGHLVLNNLEYTPKHLLLRAIRLEGIPSFSTFSQGCTPSFGVYYYNTPIYQSKVFENIRKTDELAELVLPQSLPLCRDVKVEFYHNHRIGSKDDMFHIWFNTSFHDMHAMKRKVKQSDETAERDVNDTTKVLVFSLDDLDFKVSKTKKHFPPTFQVHLVVEEVGGTTTPSYNINNENVESLSFSDESGSLSDLEAEWDSPLEMEKSSAADYTNPVVGEDSNLSEEQICTDKDATILELQRQLQESVTKLSESEKRATIFARKLMGRKKRLVTTEARAKVAEEAKTEAETITKEAEERLRVAKNDKEKEQTARKEKEQQSQELEERLACAEAKTADAERNAEEAEAKVKAQQQFWVVQKEEVELTTEELGRGGWAVVKVAHFRGLRVAAKCLHSMIITPYNRCMFMREMSIAASVRHPNLVQFIGATIEGEPVIISELMAKSLRELLEQGSPIPSSQLVSISTDVARALNYLHLVNPSPIIHRDVSSGNVLLEPSGGDTWKAKLADYGSANFTQLAKTAAPGCPAYAAPESLTPTLHSPKMDVFSYGVLLIETFTQQFPDPAARELMTKTIHEPVIVELIQQCLQQEPQSRPSMSNVLRSLSEV